MRGAIGARQELRKQGEREAAEKNNRQRVGGGSEPGSAVKYTKDE